MNDAGSQEEEQACHHHQGGKFNLSHHGMYACVVLTIISVLLLSNIEVNNAEIYSIIYFVLLSKTY